MNVDAVTSPGSALLGALRGVLADSDDALLCVAFAQARGVHLIAKEVTALARRGRARVLVTNVFGATTDVALGALREAGASVRVLNPGGSTYHPKVFLGRSGDRVAAMVGSSNLTSGLVANVEAATLLRGTAGEHPIAALWTWGESMWADPRGVDYTATPIDRDEEIEPELLVALAAVASANPVVYTLGTSPKENRIAEVTPSGIWVETERSRERETGAQVVAPRMLNLAWDVLRARGKLTNREMLDELRIHRSSFVCAILGQLPDVTVTSKSPIELTYQLPP
ncbi:MAG: phospholipase D family protein [Myxococcota bacterium]|nr:phospholipase D family protein [Myxococcota bacterium]